MQKGLKNVLFFLTVLYAGAAVLSGCTQNDDSGADSPDLNVSLSASSTSVHSNEWFTVTASVSNASGTPTYAWYMDGTYKDSGTSSVSCCFTVTSSGYHTVSVSVTDSKMTKTSSVSIYVIASGGLSVSLAASSTSVYSDQSFVLTASVSNASGTPSYKWYLDDDYQSGVTDSKVTCWFLVTSSGYHTVKVSVTDSSTTESKSVSIYVTAAGSMYIHNSSSYSILYLYDKLHSNSSYSSYDATISSGKYYTIYDIPAGYYDWKAQSSAYTYTVTNCYFSPSIGRRTWTLYNGSNNVANEGGTGTFEMVEGMEETGGSIVDASSDTLYSIPFSALQN
jgi:hypothetical protein